MDKRGPRKFCDGERVVALYGAKSGVIRRLRNDEYEKTQAVENHYFVDYDDKTFEAYESESFLKKLIS